VGERGPLGRLEVCALLSCLLRDIVTGVGSYEAGEESKAGNGLDKEFHSLNSRKSLLEQ
jgi:hypothetical protein